MNSGHYLNCGAHPADTEKQGPIESLLKSIEDLLNTMNQHISNIFTAVKDKSAEKRDLRNMTDWFIDRKENTKQSTTDQLKLKGEKTESTDTSVLQHLKEKSMKNISGEATQIKKPKITLSGLQEKSIGRLRGGDKIWQKNTLD